MFSSVLNSLYGIDGLARQLDTVALVCGCRHSGTTLIMNILAASDDVHITYHEGKVFKVRRPLLSRRRLATFLRGAIESGRRVAVEKYPRSVYAIPLAFSILPSLRVVIPVRDGRDVVASCLVKGIPWDDISVNWRRSAEIADRWSDDPRVFVYRHEDLVRDPEPTIRRICDHLGLEFRPELLNYHEKPRMWFGQTELRKGDGSNTPENAALRNWQVNQPFFDNSGRWKTDLPATYVDRFETGPLGAMMRRFGYL
jgi:hypothetical protein